MATKTPKSPLRREAERRWEERKPSAAKPSRRAGLQELEVHQIELEMQNEELHFAQQAALDARNRYLDIYDFVPVAYLTLDVNRVIREANLTAATLLGVQRGKLLGARMERFVEMQSRDNFYLHLQSVREAPASRACVLAIDRGDGGQFFARLESRAYPLAGGAVQYRTVLTDVTSLRQAEEALEQSERRFRALTEKAADYVTVTNARGAISYENPSVRQTFGATPEDVRSRGIFEFAHPEELDAVRDFFAKIVRRREESMEAEFRARTPDGSWRWLHVVATNLLDDPAVQGVVFNARDITERREAVDELKLLNEQLDERVRKRTQALEILHDVASVANRSQNLQEALDLCLHRLTDYNGWRFGHAFVPAAKESAGLVMECDWYPAAAERFLSFRAATAGQGFRRGKGLVRRAIAEQQPQWSTQLHRDLAAPRAATAAKLGLNTAVVFPVVVGERVVAVLEFFSDLTIPRDERFCDLLVSVGMQLGRIAERATFEERLLAIADETQRAIAQDLHDDLGQELTGLVLKAETLVEMLGHSSNGQGKLAADIMTAAERARDKSRALARRNLPVEIELGSLPGALERLAEAAAAGSHAACAFANKHPKPAFDNRVATHLYRIAQEAVSNAVRHGQPGEIQITLMAENGETLLEVADDGQGLPDERKSCDGLGLRIMRYRAELIGGTLEIGPRSPHGTVLSCRLPNGKPAKQETGNRKQETGNRKQETGRNGGRREDRGKGGDCLAAVNASLPPCPGFA